MLEARDILKNNGVLFFYEVCGEKDIGEVLEGHDKERKGRGGIEYKTCTSTNLRYQLPLSRCNNTS